MALITKCLFVCLQVLELWETRPIPCNANDYDPTYRQITPEPKRGYGRLPKTNAQLLTPSQIFFNADGSSFTSIFQSHHPLCCFTISSTFLYSTATLSVCTILPGGSSTSFVVLPPRLCHPPPATLVLFPPEVPGLIPVTLLLVLLVPSKTLSPANRLKLFVTLLDSCQFSNLLLLHHTEESKPPPLPWFLPYLSALPDSC